MMTTATAPVIPVSDTLAGDSIWVVLIKAVAILVFLLISVLFAVWFDPSTRPLPDGRGSVTSRSDCSMFPSRERQRAVLSILCQSMRILLLALPLALAAQTGPWSTVTKSGYGFFHEPGLWRTSDGVLHGGRTSDPGGQPDRRASGPRSPTRCWFRAPRAR